MDATLRTFGEIAGVAGLAIGVCLYVFRDIIRKTVFRNLPPALSYRVIRMVIGAAWSLAVLGILVRFVPDTVAVQTGNQSQQNVGAPASGGGR